MQYDIIYKNEEETPTSEMGCKLAPRPCSPEANKRVLAAGLLAFTLSTCSQHPTTPPASDLFHAALSTNDCHSLSTSEAELVCIASPSTQRILNVVAR